MKQLQDAYIVAATRTPIGRSHRGFFRNTRPDDLLATILKAALAQAPGLDPAAIEDIICGCAIPEAQQESMRASDKGEVTVQVTVTDEAGTQPVECEFTWAWIPSGPPKR